jgi:uncharacterized protein YbjT (DUF2867 family)
MKQRAGPILVTGATGNTGRAIADAVVEREAPVRAMARTEADRSKLRAGGEVVVADFDEVAAAAAAPGGAGRAYLVTPSSERAEEQQKRFADLAARAGTRPARCAERGLAPSAHRRKFGLCQIFSRRYRFTCAM